MATYTPNYNLSKPESTDDYRDFINSYGDNMDKIDQNMGGGGGGGGHTIVDPTGTDMPQENKLKFTGAVNVSDDAVNGQTVVDVEGGGNYYLNTIYSTEEKKVGYWTDGKPLYQRTITYETPFNITNGSWYESSAIYPDMNIVNSDIVNSVFAHYTGAIVTIENSKLVIGNQTKNQPMNNIKYVTIQYTKTTDTPESNPQTGGVIYLPTIYSDEEREIGVWTDGKPLYQKTINIASTTIPSGGSVTFSLQTLGIQNVEKIINADGTAMAGTTTVPFNYLNISTNVMYAITLTIEGDALMLGRSQSSSITLTDVYITVQYTKTTDVAGSGSWTPSGANAVHYSTNEQVIGTWIDGKPLYEKTFNFTGTYSGDQGSVPINMSIADTIFPVEAWGINSGNAICPFPYVHSSANNNGGFFISVDKNSIGLRFASGLTFKKVVITLRYTKTTD